MDCFAALGLPATATAAQVRRAYRLRAQWLHPDHRPNDDEAAVRFAALHDAYLNALASLQRQEGEAPPPSAIPGFGIAGRRYARRADGVIAWRNEATGEWTMVANGALPFAGHLAGRGAGRIARWWRS